MVSEKKKEECCGCSACAQACPKNAISMVEDEKGFLYPSIDMKLCVNCGICDRVCGFTVDYAQFDSMPKILAVKHKKDIVRDTSTSGGMFTALADEILSAGGTIYGAKYDEKFRVIHARATDVDGYKLFKGSKYVQSDVLITYQQAKTDLQQGKKVLYSGTPCQIAGLKAYLGKDNDNLITVDLLCHGVPSPRIWREFISLIEKKAKAAVSSVNFRDKSNGWSKSGRLVFTYPTRKSHIWGENSFNTLFLKNLILRESCYNCKFRSYTRVSDITLADFWGIQTVSPDFFDEKGVSLVMINSKKGQQLFDRVSCRIESQERTAADCRQDQITGPVVRNKDTDEFWDIYLQKGLKKILVKYTEFSMIKTFSFKVLRRMKRILKVE